MAANNEPNDTSVDDPAAAYTPAELMETFGRAYQDYGFSSYDEIDAHIRDTLTGKQAGKDPDPYCAACLEELDPDGEALEGWISADPFLHTIEDNDAAPAQYRQDADTVIKEYTALYCPNHPQRFLAHFTQRFEDPTES